jgi:hypothetical protein
MRLSVYRLSTFVDLTWATEMGFQSPFNGRDLIDQSVGTNSVKNDHLAKI